MSFTYGFFNAQYNAADIPDRSYNAEQMSELFDGMIMDGIYMYVGNQLAVIPAPNDPMRVMIRSGRCWFDKHWLKNDTDTLLDGASNLFTASPLYDRYDDVVVEVNTALSGRTVTIKRVAGTAASTPRRPTLAANQHAIAWVNVPRGATQLTAANIHYLGGTNECPWVSGLLETISAQVLYDGWGDEFREWFANRQAELTAWVEESRGIISQEAATTLATKITEMRNVLGNVYVPKTGWTQLTNAQVNASHPAANVGLYFIDLACPGMTSAGSPDIDIYHPDDVTRTTWTDEYETGWAEFLDTGFVTTLRTGYVTLWSYNPLTHNFYIKIKGIY